MDFKKENIGTFKIFRNDSINDYLIRNNDSQIRYYGNPNLEPQHSKIKWISNKAYSLEVLNANSKFDSLVFLVEIDSIKNDTFYESI
ncbi:hypothetical protein [Winogradskyella luteola]|uniref:Uncharacterized protein n=1 Tax=Winogradskyella luteola TaxID=2828330 RepID=A0A9X1FA90_9FLAO|nr:hypothetical protein [Winogradskyella luteola]MBV7270166.1 hypothetical protein [Winogradskyella luteola]